MDEAVSIVGLKKTYGALAAVDGIDISVARGEIFGLLGRNGAGKTTAIECALGLRRPDSGRVRLLGLDPEKDRKRLFQRVGAQLQESGYQFKIRLRELCEQSSAFYAAPADWRELVESFGLAGKERSFVSELSGGQRQRLAIVLALLPRPELVFLDEMTTGLDPAARRKVWACIEELRAKGATIVLCSHFMDEVERLCDRVAIMRSGRVVASGSPAGLVQEGGTANLEELFLRYADAETAEEEAC